MYGKISWCGLILAWTTLHSFANLEFLHLIFISSSRHFYGVSEKVVVNVKTNEIKLFMLCRKNISLVGWRYSIVFRIMSYIIVVKHYVSIRRSHLFDKNIPYHLFLHVGRESSNYFFSHRYLTLMVLGDCVYRLTP